jgi:hypothetical protein
MKTLGKAAEEVYFAHGKLLGERKISVRLSRNFRVALLDIFGIFTVFNSTVIFLFKKFLQRRKLC